MNLSKIAEEVSKEIILEKNAVQKPKVLALTGLQYAGKSYLAEKITAINFAHFWATKIKKAYNLTNPEMTEVLLEVIEQVSSADYNLVIDFVNHKYEMRKLLQDKAQSLSVDYRVVFIDTPVQERLKRRETNLKTGDKPGRRVISLEQMKQFEDEFELPQEIEPTIVLRTQHDIDEFLASL